jgi:hypothetical protein
MATSLPAVSSAPFSEQAEKQTRQSSIAERTAIVFFIFYPPFLSADTILSPVALKCNHKIKNT